MSTFIKRKKRKKILIGFSPNQTPHSFNLSKKELIRKIQGRFGTNYPSIKISISCDNITCAPRCEELYEALGEYILINLPQDQFLLVRGSLDEMNKRKNGEGNPLIKDEPAKFYRMIESKEFGKGDVDQRKKLLSSLSPRAVLEIYNIGVFAKSRLPVWRRLLQKDFNVDLFTTYPDIERIIIEKSQLIWDNHFLPTINQIFTDQ